jgi:hypothetical protein
MKLGKLHIRKRHVPHICAGLFALWLVVTLAMPLVALPSRAEAETLRLRSVKLSDVTTASTNVNYLFNFETYTSGPVGSISFQICSNYIYEPTDICIPPPGFSAAGTALSAQTGVTDFSLDPSSTASMLLITRPAATPVSPQALSYEFTGITNPSNIGSYYVHIMTFASTDGSGLHTDYGDVVFATNEDITITTEVPPYLYFCVGITIQGFNCGTVEGGFLSFGELSAATARTASSQMLAATNAPYGYSITLAGTTLTAGNNVIPAMNGGVSQPGISQFGLNARANTGPVVGADPDGPGLTTPSSPYNTPNFFRFQSGEIIASSNNTDDYRKLTVSYIVNRDREQAPGRYVATVSYICLANF